MKNFSKLFTVAILGMLATGAAADTLPCAQCAPPALESSPPRQESTPQGQEGTHREQIKADRAKYDSENERVTTRPWDVIKPAKPLPEKSK